jgi:hypothetical protein
MYFQSEVVSCMPNKLDLLCYLKFGAGQKNWLKKF